MTPTAAEGIEDLGAAGDHLHRLGDDEREVEARGVRRVVDGGEPRGRAVRPAIGVDDRLAGGLGAVDARLGDAAVDHLDARRGAAAGERERERVAVAPEQHGLPVDARGADLQDVVEAEHERPERVRVGHVERGAAPEAEGLGVEADLGLDGADVHARLRGRRLDAVVRLGAPASGEGHDPSDPDDDPEAEPRHGVVAHRIQPIKTNWSGSRAQSAHRGARRRKRAASRAM